VVYCVYNSSFEGDAAAGDKSPNAFEVYLDLKHNNNKVSFSTVLQWFPFEPKDVRFFILNSLNSNSPVKNYWLEYNCPSKGQFVCLGKDRLIVMKLCPKTDQHGISISTQIFHAKIPNEDPMRKKSNKPWWHSFVLDSDETSIQTQRAKPSARSKPNMHKHEQEHNYEKQTESRNGLNIATNINVKSVQKGLSSLTSWAKKGFTQGLSQASDYVGSISSETVELSSCSVKLGRKIADGGFSQVYVVQRATVNGPELFALKRCLAHSKEDLNDLKNEISIHKAVSSPHVLKLYDYGVANSRKLSGVKEVSLLFPLLDKPGSMYDQMETHLQNETASVWPYNEKAAAELMTGVCTGLKSIHEAGYMHRDIKPHNVLFKVVDERAYNSCNGDIFPQNAAIVRPILMDLGSCSNSSIKISGRKEALMLQDEASVKCSAPYRSPEFIEVPQNGVIDESADIWSIGCMLYAISFGRSYSPFEDPIQGVMNLAILQGNVKFPEGNRANGYTYSQKWSNLIKSILQVKPEARPSLDSIIEQLKLI